MTDIAALARSAKAWPFQEARNLWDKRLKATVPEKGYVLFETGYGPSGLPHIGTFGEVVRTTMVRRALEQLVPDVPTKLFAFSDDMDGLRKVPDNVPNQEMLAEHLGKPLTAVPDPFGTHDSFGAHNNARLQTFLDSFGFEYDFKSATECYRSGLFDEALLAVLQNYEAVINVILPTLGAERQATYSPFLPVDPETGVVLQVPVVERDVDAGTIVYEREDGKKVETPVTGGACKLQWKCDWAMRWFALGVDYEMSGKDLMESVTLSSKICRILGAKPPQNLTYELFLDDQGQKISKSKGNGIAVEEWLKYAPQESLALFMYQKPATAKRLFFDVIPKAVDEYISFAGNVGGQEPDKQVENPAWHIHGGDLSVVHGSPVSFGLLLNLVSASHADEPATLWKFIGRYSEGASAETDPYLDQLVGYAIAYYQDFVAPTKSYRAMTDAERPAFQMLRDQLAAASGSEEAADYQTMVFEAGKAHEDVFPAIKEWFKAIYQVLFGQDQGPRMGSFIELFGRDETLAVLDKALAGESLA